MLEKEEDCVRCFYFGFPFRPTGRSHRGEASDRVIFKRSSILRWSVTCQLSLCLLCRQWLSSLERERKDLTPLRVHWLRPGTIIMKTSSDTVSRLVHYLKGVLAICYLLSFLQGGLGSRTYRRSSRSSLRSGSYWWRCTCSAMGTTGPSGPGPVNRPTISRQALVGVVVRGELFPKRIRAWRS